MGIVLDVKNVARTFSENKGILDISFQLKQREILFLYGEHDTGKTLLLQILIGAILRLKKHYHTFHYYSEL